MVRSDGTPLIVMVDVLRTVVVFHSVVLFVFVVVLVVVKFDVFVMVVTF